MIKSRPLFVARMLVLGAAATFVMVNAPVARAEVPAPAPAAVTAQANKAEANAKGREAKGAKSANERFARLTKQLKLTPDQQGKVKPIVIEEMAQWSALRDKYAAQPTTADSKVAMDKERDAMHAEFDGKLARVLTADQMAELKKMHAEHVKHASAKEEKEEKGEKTEKGEK